jgi:hypothetical protein
MTALSILVRVCVWVLGFLQTRGFWSTHGFVSLSFALQQFFYSCFCLFDAIVVFHAMGEITFINFFSLESERGFCIQ